jgi:CRISPR-associated protein Csh1
MIKEIVEFMDANEGIEEYFIQNEVSKAYEHYYIKINGDIICRSVIDLDLLNDEEMKNILKYMTYYQKGMHNKYLDKDNGLGGSSPYISTVKLFFDGNFIKTNIEKKDKNRIEVQFKSSLDYIKNDIERNEITELQKFMIGNLENFLLSEKQFIEILKKKYDNQKKDKKAVSIDIRIYIDVGLDKVKNFYESFVKKRAFLDTKTAGLYKGKCSICECISDELSLPYVLNTLGTKTFEMKPTMPLDITNAICKTCTLQLHKFKVMTDNNQLTKPFPLFIDKKSLFGQQRAVLNDSEKKKKYKEIIKAIWKSNPKDLKNFYLLNYYSKPDNGWKLQVKDIDYIENFEYMTPFKIMNFMEARNHKILLNNKIVDLSSLYEDYLSIFQFEKICNELIFEEKLIGNYFTSYDDDKLKMTYSKINSKNSNSLLKNYLIKYRQGFYDFIYKSYQSSLDSIEFREMILNIIKDNIKHDDNNKDGYSIYENEIKEKLNLLYSIKHHFKNGGEKVEQGEFVKLKEKMISSLGYWQNQKNEKDELVLKDNDEPRKEFIGGVDHIENDDKFFAFLCGQMARFLISKKKGKEENKSHSDFNAFTDWQTSKLLKEYICEVHRKYAYELRLDRKYDNAMSIILSYKDDLEMDDVMEYMMAGYFADNQIKYQNNQTQENKNE